MTTIAPAVLKSIGSLYTTTSPKSTHHRLQILIFQISAIQIRVFLVVYFYHRQLAMMFVDASHPQETALIKVQWIMKITLTLTKNNACDVPTCDLSVGFLPLQVNKGHWETLAITTMS